MSEKAPVEMQGMEQSLNEKDLKGIISNSTDSDLETRISKNTQKNVR